MAWTEFHDFAVAPRDFVVAPLVGAIASLERFLFAPQRLDQGTDQLCQFTCH